ncbi:MAG: 2Fe-2S iron-sulfur cluster-binding protein [Candidatus Hadarchaeales archaeon]
MKEVTLEIDGKVVRAKEGMTILQAAKEAGIEIPTLCYHEEMEPYGVCRICVVEIERGGRSRTVASCCYPVEEGLKVRTRTPKIERVRKTILELAAITAGEDVGGEVRALAFQYGANLSRFVSLGLVEPSKCILCGLCVRRCIEAQWDNAIDFVGRGVGRRVALMPGKEEACKTCSYCYRVCPTGRITSFGPNPPFSPP